MARYTDADRRKAVDLYLTEGPEAAADAIGCTRQTVYNWLGFYNVQAKNNDQRRADTAERHAARIEAIREVLADRVLELATALHPERENLREVATAMGIGIDKLRLMSGEATARTEVVSPIDRELERALDELNRQHA